MTRLISINVVCFLASSFIFEVVALTLKSPDTNPTLPSNGRVALIIRGLSFRKAPKDSCKPAKERCSCLGDSETMRKQDWAFDSWLTQVITPLEKLGNKVDVVLNDDKTCNLTSHVASKVGEWRVIAVGKHEAPTQALSYRAALDTFKNHTSVDPSSYDLIMIVRMEQVFMEPITTWPSDFRLFNFADVCILEQQNMTRDSMPGWSRFFDDKPCSADENLFYGKYCTCDWIHTMPGKFFQAFDSIMPDGCFVCGGDAHVCAEGVMATSIGTNVGLLFQAGADPESWHGREPNHIPHWAPIYTHPWQHTSSWQHATS